MTIYSFKKYVHNIATDFPFSISIYPAANDNMNIVFCMFLSRDSRRVTASAAGLEVTKQREHHE